MQPLHQRQVVGQTAKQGHGGVAVAIDQPRHDQTATGINGPRGPQGGGQAGHRADGVDGGVVDGDKAVAQGLSLARGGQDQAVGDQQVNGLGHGARAGFDR